MSSFVEITCHICNKTVLKKKAEITRRVKSGAKYLFCSLRCSGIYSNKKTPRTPPSTKDTTKYSWDESVIKIDMELRYYLLGICMADSSVNFKKKSGLITGINLTSCDIDILEKIKNRLSLTSDITPVRIPKEGHKQAYYLLFSSHIGRTIYDIGMTGYVKKNRKLPDMPDKYFSHFLRGYFDGDGSLSVRCRYKDSKDFIISINCHPILAEGLHNKLSNILNLPKVFYEDGVVGDITYYAENAKILSKYLYENATIYMERKYKIYQEYFSQLHN